MSVTYTAVLDASEDSVLFLSALLHAERLRRGTRKGTRALSTCNQAVLREKTQSAERLVAAGVTDTPQPLG